MKYIVNRYKSKESDFYNVVQKLACTAICCKIILIFFLVWSPWSYRLCFVLLLLATFPYLGHLQLDASQILSKHCFLGQPWVRGLIGQPPHCLSEGCFYYRALITFSNVSILFKVWLSHFFFLNCCHVHLPS